MGGNKPVGMKRFPYGQFARRDGPTGPSMEVNNGRRATINESKFDKALEKVTEAVYGLWTLKDMCENDWSAYEYEDEKRDAADDIKGLEGQLDKIADGYFDKECDHELFCSNLEWLQDLFASWNYTVEDPDLLEAEKFCDEL